MQVNQSLDGSFYFQNGNGKWTFSIVNTSNVAVSAEQSAAVVANKWYHLLGTFDGSNIKLYVDGSLEDTTAFTGTLTNTNWRYVSRRGLL